MTHQNKISDRKTISNTNLMYFHILYVQGGLWTRLANFVKEPQQKHSARWSPKLHKQGDGVSVPWWQIYSISKVEYQIASLTSPTKNQQIIVCVSWKQVIPDSINQSIEFQKKLSPHLKWGVLVSTDSTPTPTPSIPMTARTAASIFLSQRLFFILTDWISLFYTEEEMSVFSPHLSFLRLLLVSDFL